MEEHVVILGGGFAGWYAARALGPRLRAGARVTLIDRVDHMLYTPMLTEVAGGTLRPGTVAVSMQSLNRRVRFVRADVQEIDVDRRTVTLPSGEILQATHLVFALGATTAYHGVEGGKAQSMPLKTLAHATDIVARVEALVEEAAGCAEPERRRELLTLVVAGGGYTGVETIAAVAENLRRKAAGRGLAADEVRAVLLEPSERLMHETPESLALYSQHLLEQTGVQVMLNTGVKKVEGSAITLTNGEQITAGMLLWDAGIEPNPLVGEVGLPLGHHGGVVVDACFQVKGKPGVWAIGDCAEIPQADGETYAPTAQNATREGVHLAQNISAVIRGEAPRPFRFKMLGQLAILSHRKAVAEILGVKLTGLLAWGMWWVIYTAKLPSSRGRVEVVKQLAG